MTLAITAETAAVECTVCGRSASVAVDRMSVAELDAIIGGLSSPSKMPGYGYSLPAAVCITGAKLRAASTPEKPTICGGCYAMKGRYVFDNVQRAMYRRLHCLDHPLWADAFAERLNRIAANKRTNKSARDSFRWHDSGDIRSVAHLVAICRVAELVPAMRFWLPTREYRIVVDFVTAGHAIPGNLNIRLSAHMIGGHVPTFPKLKGVRGITVSTVSRNDSDYPNAHACPARHQGNSCGDCRACWNVDIPHVDYHLH